MAAIRLIAKVPTLAAFAYRHSLGLPYVYPDNELNYSENFLSMLFRMENTYEPDPRLAKALDVLFILHADHEQNCSTNAVRSVGSSDVDPYSAVAAGVAALYGPAARRRQRGGAADAARDRDDREHPRLPRGRQEPRGEADGLRPPGLQELRPAGADHQEARRRGARGDRREPAAGHRHRAREAGARRRILHRAQALPERRLLLGPDLRGAGDPHRHVHGDLRDPADLRLGRPVDGDEARPRAEDRPAPPDLHRRARRGLHRRSSSARAPRRSPARRQAVRSGSAAAPRRPPGAGGLEGDRQARLGCGPSGSFEIARRGARGGPRPGSARCSARDGSGPASALRDYDPRAARPRPDRDLRHGAAPRSRGRHRRDGRRLP